MVPSVIDQKAAHINCKSLFLAPNVIVLLDIFKKRITIFGTFFQASAVTPDVLIQFDPKRIVGE